MKNFNVNNNIVRFKKRKHKLKRFSKVKGYAKLLIALGIGLGSVGVITSIATDIIDGDKKGDTTEGKKEFDDPLSYYKDFYVLADEISPVAFVYDGCDVDKIENLVGKLQDFGVNCEFLDSIDKVSESDAKFFVALKNYGGDDIKVLANYNSVNNDSDNLAASMASAFSQDITSIQAGQKDAERDFVPTNIERKFNDKVSVSLGIPDSMEEIDADCIIDGLSKNQCFYTYGKGDNNDSYLYRVKIGQGKDSLPDKVASFNDDYLYDKDLLTYNEILKNNDFFDNHSILTIKYENYHHKK